MLTINDKYLCNKPYCNKKIMTSKTDGILCFLLLLKVYSIEFPAKDCLYDHIFFNQNLYELTKN